MKTIIYFVEHHSTNWPLIWHDCSPFIVISLAISLLISVWYAKKQVESIYDYYLVKTTAKLCELNGKIDDLEAENKKLSDSVRKRDKTGHFLPTSGKGHGKKDWSKCTPDQLIAEAKRRYKKGSTVVSHGNFEVKIASDAFYTSEKGDIFYIGYEWNSMVYSGGTWAKKAVK